MSSLPMSSLPFSAPTARSLATASTGQPIEQLLNSWWAQLNPLVENKKPQPTPLNFSVTNSRGGLTLSWSPVSGGDGYEILKSPKGSFTDDLQIIPVKDVNQSKFFDALGGNAQTVRYRIRTTSGTAANPQSRRGPESGVISHTSIDASDTQSIPTTKLDNFTTDQTRSLARLGNYGAIKVSPLGQSGGSTVASGTNSLKGNPAGQSASGTSSFSSLGTSENTSATLSVGGSAQIIPDPNNPGVIDATDLQGTPVTTTAPANGQIPQYSAASGQIQYSSIIATGTQTGLQAVMPLGLGEIYVAYDTGNLFIGTPGYGVGYLQVSDMSQVNDSLQQMLAEIKNVRLAIVALDGTLLPQDFESVGKQIENGAAVGDVQ